VLCRPGLFYRINNMAGRFREFGPLGRRNPGKMKAAWLHDPCVLELALKQSEFAPRVQIALYIMAVSGMASGNPDPIRAMPEGGQDELRVYPARAGHADYPDVCRILETAYPGEVGRAVRTPVA
jgi:hypothetical protein